MFGPIREYDVAYISPDDQQRRRRSQLDMGVTPGCYAARFRPDFRIWRTALRTLSGSIESIE
jgi:hypothetical protein